MKTVKILRNKHILTSEVVLLKAEINYTEVHFDNGRIITLSKTLKKLHDDFAEHGFFRISKKNMINIKYLSKVFENYSMVKLKNNIELSVSRRRREELRAFIYVKNVRH
jgi:DNA-binding LytR/AlgR family response regulator